MIAFLNLFQIFEFEENLAIGLKSRDDEIWGDGGNQLIQERVIVFYEVISFVFQLVEVGPVEVNDRGVVELLLFNLEYFFSVFGSQNVETAVLQRI